MTLSLVWRSGHRRALACDFLVMTRWSTGLRMGGSRPFWWNSRSVHMVRTRTSDYSWARERGKGAGTGARKIGKSLQGGGAAGETAVPDCVRVTQRYTRKGKIGAWWAVPKNGIPKSGP
ncbi:hypothetical protein GCM10010389_02700 [Streptomyces echinoruber]|uniref:Uncharacterized protein n=1 Tax=Streptomyces echinoruber TaxID=68898 RepID=A0A918V4W4_9ACTN|nr:hypothetical protein GCM10010389_02700 [Streptomyces echinoruber]